MNIKNCQSEMRAAFQGGFAGQLVSGLIWLSAAAASTWLRPSYGMALLFFGSMLIFPLTQGMLRLIGKKGKVSTDNKLWGLGTQTAFTVPINFLLVGAATLYHENWFFPASLIVVGAHYLPFITLYGMKMFAALAFVMVSTGVGLGFFGYDVFDTGGWVGAVTLFVFSFIGRQIAIREEKGLDLG